MYGWLAIRSLTLPGRLLVMFGSRSRGVVYGVAPQYLPITVKYFDIEVTDGIFEVSSVLL